MIETWTFEWRCFGRLMLRLRWKRQLPCRVVYNSEKREQEEEEEEEEDDDV